MRVHVIVNRLARDLSSPGPLLAELHSPRPGVRVIETRSLEQLDAAAFDIARGPEAAVLIAGGDGSYMAGVTALARAFGDRPLPPIALGPGGTVGTIARNWGPTGPRRTSIRRLLDALVSGSVRATRRPTLRVSDDVSERIGFIVGAGLVARFFELYESHGANGNVTAASIVARIFAGSFVRSRFARSVLDPTACEIEIDGQRAHFHRISLLCASVVRDVGLGLRLLYRAGEELDRFHAVATPLGPRALGPQMPLVFAGRPLVGPRIDDLTRTLTARFPNHDGAYVLDGDLFHTNAFTVTAGPALDVLTL